MKLEHSEQHLIATRGILATARASISMNAHMFQMLAKMYSDPIRAVVRELAANAVDAHVANGCPDKPFQVKLPSNADSEFYIKDFGTGMSHETVMDLFMTYGASTKRSANTEIGGFGIGSKSPYAYTDQYSMVVAHGGKQRTYGAYVDNNGIPTISLLQEIDATPEWPTGVQIRIPVKSVDFNAFKDRAQQVYQWFRVQPTVLGDVGIIAIKIQDQHTGWARYDPLSGNQPTSNFVSMGGIAYPLDIATHFITHPMAPIMGADRYSNGSVAPFLLEFKIGELMITPSRESLQYNDLTKKAINEKLSGIAQWLGNKIADDIEDTTTTQWTKHKTVSYKWKSNKGYNLHFPNAVLKLLTHVKRSNPEIERFITNMWTDWIPLSWKDLGLPADGSSDPIQFDQTRNGVCKRTTLTQIREKVYIHPDRNFTLYYTDGPTKASLTRIRQYLLTKGPHQLEVLWAKDLDTAKLISKALGDPGYKPLSSLPYTKPALKANGPRKKGGLPLDMDQEITWTNFAKQVKHCKLKDVPVSARYWLIRTGMKRLHRNAAGRHSYRTSRTADGKGWNNSDPYVVTSILNAFGTLEQHQLMNPKYTGYIITSAAWWAKNRKAEDLKWDFFMNIASDAINVPALEALMKNVPPINMATEVQFVTQGFLAFLKRIEDRPDYWRVIEPVVKSTGLDIPFNQYIKWMSAKAVNSGKIKTDVQQALRNLDQGSAINIESTKLDFSTFYRDMIKPFPFIRAFELDELSMSILALKPEDAAIRVKTLLITEQELQQLNLLKDAA